tara:strand:- start:320 stop:601 length:282 start_codon:yes stop_codon:yes gene_type:complete
MKISYEISESIVENLLIEIEMINGRIKKLVMNYNQTVNIDFKKRLIEEYKDLSYRLKEINKTSNTLTKFTSNKISLSSLLLVQSNKSLKQVMK